MDTLIKVIYVAYFLVVYFPFHTTLHVEVVKVTLH